MIYHVRNAKTGALVIETGDTQFAEFVKDEMNAQTGTFNYEVRIIQ